MLLEINASLLLERDHLLSAQCEFNHCCFSCFHGMQATDSFAWYMPTSTVIPVTTSKTTKMSAMTFVSLRITGKCD